MMDSTVAKIGRSMKKRENKVRPRGVPYATAASRNRCASASASASRLPRFGPRFGYRFVAAAAPSCDRGISITFRTRHLALVADALQAVQHHLFAGFQAALDHPQAVLVRADGDVPGGDFALAVVVGGPTT